MAGKINQGSSSAKRCGASFFFGSSIQYSVFRSRLIREEVMNGNTKSASDPIKGTQRTRADGLVPFFAQVQFPIVAASSGVNDGLIGQPGFLHQCPERDTFGLHKLFDSAFHDNPCSVKICIVFLGHFT